jgi:hypothetical protein
MNNEIQAEIVREPETNLARSSMAGEVLAFQGEIDPVKLREIAEKRIAFFDSVAKLSLLRTSVHDWVDQGGKPYLQATGAEKLMAVWGIYTRDVKITVEMDASTGFPAYEVTGRVGSRTLGTEMDVVGGRNANDNFFQKQLAATGKLDLQDVRKTAYSNWIANAVTRLIGMRGMTWEEVATATHNRINKQTCTGKVEYRKNDSGPQAPATQAAPNESEPMGKQAESPRGPIPSSGAAGGPPPGPYITEPQAKRFYAIGKSAGWSDAEMKDYLLREHNIQSSREIPRSLYEEICNEMESGGGR